MKKRILGLFTVFCVLYLSACFSPLEGDSGKGSLTITIGSSARSFYNVDNGDGINFSHEISLKNAGGSVNINKPLSGLSESISVPAGTYTVTVKGSDANETLRSYGTEFGVEVIEGRNTSVPIKMYSAVEVGNEATLSGAFEEAGKEENSVRMLYVFVNDTFSVDQTISLASGNVTLVAENGAVIRGGNGSLFSISGSAVLRLGGEGMTETITLTGSGNNVAPLINVNGGTLVMDGVTISGNNHNGNGGGVSVTSGTVRIVTGTIYGSNEADPNLRNTAGSGAALHNEGTVEYGTFSGTTWNGEGNHLFTTNETIRVVNGELLSVRLTGTVSISGTPEVGQILTAVTTALGGSGTITYQWRRVGTGDSIDDIGANDTYLIQADDTGSTITVTVTRSDNIGSVSAEIGPITNSGTANFTITFDQITDVGDIIVDRVISLSDNEPTVTFEVQNPDQYDSGSIAWHIPAVNVHVYDEPTITLDLKTPPFDTIGEYYLTLEVEKDGVPYSKTVFFTIIP